MKKKRFAILANASERERSARAEFARQFRSCPIPEKELLTNLPLFLKRQDLSHILFLQEVYARILPVHGDIMEFGVRWGRNLALFSALRGIHEPFNHNRKIIGFDTFEGFPAIDKKDGTHAVVRKQAYGVTKGYEAYLENILAYHEQESPIAHLRKFELVKGDATRTIGAYLRANPATIIACAYFDLDIYKPTKKCLLAIRDHMPKGALVAFDQLNVKAFPGETQAFKEVLGIRKNRLIHSPYSPTQSYTILE